MKKIRIGNDIVIKWRITINGEEVNLDGLDLSLYISTTYQPRKAIAFTVAGNEITATYKGTAQKVTGVYRLTLYRNEGENSQSILDACDAFELVSCSCLTVDAAFGSAEVELPVADLGIGVPGLSAYEIALSEGFEGTQEEWLASLSAASEAAAAECREVIAEFSRAEDSRVTAEAQRVINENNRIAGEVSRAEAENDRAAAEQKRVSAESLRVSAEVIRKTAEEARKADEQQRSAAEVSRSSAEELRKSNEQSRISEETTRSNNEAARIAAETKRANAESTRKNNEDARQNDEESRQSAEADRLTNESNRTTAESQRVTNETARSNAESSRATAETARQTAEESRQEAEQGRATAEQQRADAEAARAEEFAGFEGTLAAKEDAANKVTSLDNPSDVTFPTSKAVVSQTNDAKNYTTAVISGRIVKVGQCISPDNGASLLAGGSRVFVKVKPNTSYYITCTLEYGVRFGAYAQYKEQSVSSYIDGTLVVQEAGSQNYAFILVTTAETNYIAFSSRTHDINLSIFRNESIYNTLDNVVSKIGEINNNVSNRTYTELFDMNNAAATPMPSTFIKGVEIELLDTDLLPLDLSAITVNLAYCGKSSTKYQLSTRIGGLARVIDLNGDYGKIDIPTEDLSVVEIGNEVIKVRYLLYKPNMPSDYTYTINNAKFSDSVIIPQFARYIPIDQGDYGNIFVKKGLSVISGNIYLKNILRYIKVDNYDFSNNGNVARFKINYFSWNYSTKMLYVSYRAVTTDADGNEKTLVEISGANDNTKKMADEKGLVYFDFIHSTGIRIKALYDMSSVTSNIEKNLTLANSEFRESVVLSSSAPIEIADYPNDYAKYISNKSTENCAYNMCQKLEWNRKTPRFNMALGCDFHKEVRCFEDLCYWTNDAAIKTCLSSIVVAGDYLSNGTAFSEAEWNARAKAVVDAMQYTDKPVLFCQGNHDKNWEQAGINPSLVMSDAKLRESIYNPMYNRLSATDKQNFHFPEDVADALYYYFDQSVNGRVFRYIVLNEYDLPETINENGVRKYSGTDDYTGKVTTTFATYISQSQFEFVNSVLAATPDNYVVLVVRHTPYGDTALANTGNAINSLIKAYKERTAGSVSIDALDDLSAYTIAYDFSSKTESHIVVINGHHHETKWAEDDTYGTLRLQGTALGTAGYNARFIGSATEANCDILSINTSNNEAYVLRFGVAKIVESQTYFDVSNPKIV